MRTLLRILTIVYVAYLAIALLIITPALNFAPAWYLEKNYGRNFQTEWVLLNPFTLALEVRGAQLDEPTGERFVSLSSASVNLSLESLWQPGWMLDVVAVRDLYVQLVQTREGEFNFSDLLATPAETPPPEEDTDSIPGVTIGDLNLHSESIIVVDQTRTQPLYSRWNGLKIHITELSTVYEEGRPYSIEVYGDSGGSLTWEGEVSIPGGRSEGSLTVTDLNLRKVWELAEPWLAFELTEGRLSLSGRYLLDWNEGFSYRVSDGSVGLAGLAVTPREAEALPDTSVQLGALDINGIAVDGPAQKVAINTVTVDGLALAGWLEGERLSLQEMFAGAPAATDTPAEPEADAAAEPWKVSLDKASLVNSGVQFRTAFTEPPDLSITPLEASLEHFTWPLSGESQLVLKLGVNEQVDLGIEGTLELAEGTGVLQYQLAGLPLAWFNPNLPPALKATVTGGVLQLKGEAALAAYAPTSIKLGGSLKEFSARREGVETTLTGWKSVRVKGLVVDMLERSVALSKLSIDSYTGRLHIARDGTINASNLWQEEAVTPEPGSAEPPAEAADADAATEPATVAPWSFGIPTIAVSNSEIDFMDESLPISFRTVIGDLNGEVKGLTSVPGTAARVELEGSVDGYAPVALKGSVNPFDQPMALDLLLTFDGVDLAPLSPYSSTYAGYNIDQGLLDLSLNYQLKDNHLTGKNRVRIDRLKLGDKVDSDKAIDAPLELALAILTDANGVIDMKIPVSGDVNSPGFDLRGVIGKAIMNVLTKAITAPFTLLAKLAGSEEDLQRISFGSGSTQLSAASKAKLDQLATAMAQRPKLSLVISGRLKEKTDRSRLQKNALHAQLLQAGLTPEELDAKGDAYEEAIDERFAALPAGPEPVAGDEAPSTRAQYLAVARSIEVSDKEMVALAEQRAVTVKRYLVTEAGMTAERAVIKQSPLKDKAHQFSGAELSIDS